MNLSQSLFFLFSSAILGTIVGLVRIGHCPATDGERKFGWMIVTGFILLAINVVSMINNRRAR